VYTQQSVKTKFKIYLVHCDLSIILLAYLRTKKIDFGRPLAYLRTITGPLEHGPKPNLSFNIGLQIRISGFLGRFFKFSQVNVFENFDDYSIRGLRIIILTLEQFFFFYFHIIEPKQYK
jgi:hypothetical protein